MKTSLIAAMAENRCIGVKNTIPWHIPEDFKHFKNTTMGKPMIMGRKTFESLPGMLPGRAHIVISRSAPSEDKDNLHHAGSIEQGIEIAREIATQDGQDEIFIIGGAQIYTQALDKNLIDQMYLTFVDQIPDGDAFFPEFDENAWTEISNEPHDGYRFVTFERQSA